MVIDAIITVRAASTRLPNKCFLNLGQRSVLKHVIERCLKNGLQPLVATTLNDRAIEELCRQLSIRCFAGSVDDKLERWRNACHEFNVESFITVDCDDPLFDPQLSHAQHALLADAAVVKPDLNAYLGSNGWAFKVSALNEICKKKSSDKTEMIWKHFPSDLCIQTFDARPNPIEKNLRLTLDYVEDYWLILTVVRELGFDCKREDIINLFEKNSGLQIVNSFRNEEWKQNQQNG